MAAPTKATITPEKGQAFTCMFNPDSLSIGKTNSWSPRDKARGNAPTMTFDKGGAGTFNIQEMWFDTTDTGEPVTTYTNKLLDLMKVTDGLKDSPTDTELVNRPPSVTFQWGEMMSFQAVIEKVTVKYTYFSDEGVPLRASVSVDLKQWTDENAYPLQNPTSGTPFPHRVHQVTVGESLDRIAARYYGDPTVWRLIAQANGLLDPLDLEPGDYLRIPDLGAVPRG